MTKKSENETTFCARVDLQIWNTFSPPEDVLRFYIIQKNKILKFPIVP